jgi:PaaX-like protein
MVGRCRSWVCRVAMVDEPTTEPAEAPNVRAQFLILTLFGDYILPRGGTIWTTSLLALLDLLGVGERAARSALSRMSARGWLAAHTHIPGPRAAGAWRAPALRAAFRRLGWAMAPGGLFAARKQA